ncbi:hypothetical protein ACFY1P_20800 [Streptomyces sp. NPDC001407]|uniref:hypothetical protein n=1 Tax=Streptomyces sp. NPDC001407 TaxID=3364573 RepID=UPI00368F5773
MQLTTDISAIPADSLDTHRVADHQGAAHTALFNAYTGFLIDLACGTDRHQAVHHYEKFDPARLTDAPLSCPACAAIDAGGPGAPQSVADTTRELAARVLALADSRGYAHELDNEALRLSFAALGLGTSERLYPLIREHLTAAMTQRALTVPDGTPRVLVKYTRYTGGTLMVPVGVGDRLMYDGVASGIWYTARVTAVEERPNGIVVTVLEKDWPHPSEWNAADFTRRFFKLDRGPLA